MVCGLLCIEYVHAELPESELPESELRESELRSASAGEEIPRYVFWQGEASDARKPFEIALMKAIFAESEIQFGPAEFEVSEWRISTSRAVQLMKEGERVHIQIAPYLLHKLNQQAVTILPTPVLRNILGYRQLIVNPENKKDFAEIESRGDFATKVAGQGRGWADNHVYRFNNIEVVEAPSFDGMFPMLDRHRFDYIPLGVSEAGNTIKQDSLIQYQFELVPNFIVFYPWPVNILVSIKHPDLSARIQFGLDEVIRKGTYDKLFKEHFGSLLKKLEMKNVKVIVLRTPDLPANVPTEPVFIPKANILH